MPILTLIIIIIVIIILNKKSKDKYEFKQNKNLKLVYDENNINSLNENKDKKIENKSINYNAYYKPKRYITSLTELKFYTILLEIAKELDLILFAQVSLYNIIETKQTPYKQTYFNKISSKTIDFVLVDKNNCRIKLCIELDDYTHKRKNRQERDKFINELFKSLEINLIRFNASNYYNKEALKKRIQESIVEHYYT